MNRRKPTTSPENRNSTFGQKLMIAALRESGIQNGSAFCCAVKAQLRLLLPTLGNLELSVVLAFLVARISGSAALTV